MILPTEAPVFLHWYLKMDNLSMNSAGCSWGCLKGKLGWIWQADNFWCQALLYMYFNCYCYDFQRKETLLVEFQERKKSNKFLDRRFGENDPEMGLEDKMLKRFTKERQVGLVLH